ncbi:MAG: hypothetical protein MK213_00270, partial [Planctomycetes bacterium]|nr:hypothetical protein [Planctomycetota bacterium]
LQVRASLLDGSMAVGTGLGQGAKINTRYTQQDADIQACYLTFTPPPIASPGARLVLDAAGTTIAATFSEPINPLTVMSMHSFVATSFETDEAVFSDDSLYFRHANHPGESVADYIDRQRGFHLEVDQAGTVPSSERGGRILFGPIQPGPDSRTFTLSPSAGLEDINTDPFVGYSVALRGSVDGIRDLAGNSLDFTGFVAGSPSFSTLESMLTTGNGGVSGSRYFSLRFLAVDENHDGLPEFAGQFGFSPGVMVGRPASRFKRDADPSNEYVGAGTIIPSLNIPNALPPYEPLTPAGSVVMAAYRPHDLGFGYLNPDEYDLDIAGMSWAPLGGVVFDDSFPHISLALAHAKFMPDELLNPLTGSPVWPNSGLNITGNFDENILGFAEKDPDNQPLHDESLVYEGPYTLRKINLINSESGNTMLPWPGFQNSYTWRDTTIPDWITGTNDQSVGSPPSTWLTNNSLAVPIWGAEETPSIGLPLLARFRVYPRGEFAGSNTFQVTQMFATSQLPAFRIFSAGGLDASGTWHQVIPDNSNNAGTAPTGGYNTAGVKTDAFDPFMYWAEMDFVMRVSRVFTHWFDMGAGLPAGGALAVQLEPENASQEIGTYVQIEMRGAIQVDHDGDPTVNPSPLTDVSTDFNQFGEYDGNGGVSAPSDWTTNFADLEGQQYRYFQLRVTFVNNTEQALQSRLDGLGLAWTFDPSN